LLDENHGRKREHDSKFIIMLIVIMNVPRDLPQVPPPTTTDTNFKLYDSCMPYMGMQQKLNKLHKRAARVITGSNYEIRSSGIFDKFG
jgi:hypothetical protein